MYCFVTPLVVSIPLSWLGPLIMIKSFSDGGIICSTCRAFSIISLSSAVSFLPIVAGEIVAVKRAWANKAGTLIIGNKKISSKNFFNERLIMTGDVKVNYSNAIIVLKNVNDYK